MVANAFINVGSLIATVLPLFSLNKAQPDPSKQTSVSIGVGDNAYAGGSVPHISVWDKNGYRLTQFHPKKNAHVGDKSGSNLGFSNDNYQNHNNPGKPEYVSIVMAESDGICLAAVMAAGDGVQWLWTGDIGYTCGAQWYQSNYTMGNSNAPIKCVWLDANHDNGIIAQGLSLHIRDFSGEAGLLEQYNEDQERLCQNSARMTFHPQIAVNSLVPIFKPTMSYLAETNTGDPTKPSTAGALDKPDQGKDRKTRAYPDGTKLENHKARRRQVQSIHGGRDAPDAGVGKQFVDRLTVSHMSGHSAKQLCEDSMSLGPDFVSSEEGLFCDMETSTLWPLCTATQKTECFDLDIQQIKTNNQKRGDPSKKAYKITEEWR
jgi:hypothetical protein